MHALEIYPAIPCFPVTIVWRGKGLKGFVESVGLGFTSSEELRSQQGIAGYISKACMAYLSKVDGSTTKHSDPDRTQDWERSQDSAMIASAIYGTNRHRGTIGRAYGLKCRKRDPKLVPQFVPQEDGQGALRVDYQTGVVRGGGYAHSVLDGRIAETIADERPGS